jgi:hypothetical protein
MADNYFDIRKPEQPKPTLADLTAIPDPASDQGAFFNTLMTDIKKQIDEAATKHAMQKVSEFAKEVMAQKDEAVARVMRAIRVIVNDDAIDGRTLNINIHYQE